MAMTKQAIVRRAAKHGLMARIIPLHGKQGKGLVLGSLPPIYMPGGVSTVMNPRYLDDLLAEAEKRHQRLELDRF